MNTHTQKEVLWSEAAFLQRLLPLISSWFLSGLFGEWVPGNNLHLDGGLLVFPCVNVSRLLAGQSAMAFNRYIVLLVIVEHK